MPDTDNLKRELRRRFSQLRNEVSCAEKNDAIAERVLALDEVNSADAVLIYASYKSEVGTWKIAEELLKKGIKTAFPLCGEKGSMTFHLVDDLSRLISGAYGIKEPPKELPQPRITAKTVCIVPGLAFTEKGERLGYGGGFYDRFLGAHPGIRTVALAYEKCITDSLPTGSHDIKIQRIITEERTVLCNE